MIQRLLVLVISIFSLGLSTSYAQIGDLGIYGSVPEDYRANTRYVKVESNDTDYNYGYTLPVNGLKNFNFYYSSSGYGFLPGQHYTVSYWNDSLTTMYASEIVNYIPNSGHTNGTQVSTAFNSPPSTPRGMHGRVYGRIGGVNYPFPNARVSTVPSLQNVTLDVTTNDDGYFYAYYQNGNAKQFLPVHPTILVEIYRVVITGTLNGCGFGSLVPLDAEWAPYNSIYPNLSSYFVTDAELDVGDIVITPNGCSGD